MKRSRALSRRYASRRASAAAPPPAPGAGGAPSRAAGSATSSAPHSSRAEGGTASGNASGCAPLQCARIRWKVRYSDSARNGGRPTSIWKTTQPSAHRSHAAVTPLAAESRSTSGETYLRARASASGRERESVSRECGARERAPRATARALDALGRADERVAAAVLLTLGVARVERRAEVRQFDVPVLKEQHAVAGEARARGRARARVNAWFGSAVARARAGSRRPQPPETAPRRRRAAAARRARSHFSGLRSRWMTSWVCRYSSASTSSAP